MFYISNKWYQNEVTSLKFKPYVIKQINRFLIVSLIMSVYIVGKKKIEIKKQKMIYAIFLSAIYVISDV